MSIYLSLTQWEFSEADKLPTQARGVLSIGNSSRTPLANDLVPLMSNLSYLRSNVQLEDSICNKTCELRQGVGAREVQCYAHEGTGIGMYIDPGGNEGYL